MNGLSGWIGDVRLGADPGAALQAMADRLSAGGAPIHQAAAPGAGLAATGHPKRLHWAEADGCLAAAVGDLRWSDAEAAAAARNEGHGQTLLTLYRRKGARLLDDLQGSFSVAVLDPGRRSALLAIDRMGVGTLNYSVPHPGLVLFGTNSDSLRAHPADRATIDPQAVHDFFYFIDRIPAPSSIYAEHRKLLPGHCLVVEDGSAEEVPYWHMPYQPASGAGREACAEELLGHLRRALSRTLEGEDPRHVGAFLSGGLDSSTVLGLFAEAAPQRPKAFTIGFDAQGMDETPFAKIAAERFGAAHDVYYLRPEDVMAAVGKIVTAYDEPFANSSAVPAYLCALRAREAGVDLMLAGDGGDELFAGNSRYVKDAVFDRYRHIPAALRAHLLEPVLGLPHIEKLPLARKARNYVRFARMPLGARMTSDNLYRRYRPGEVFTDDCLAVIDLAAPARLAEEICQAAGSPDKLQRMMYLDLRITLADSDLRKVARMCDLAGVRVRFPFLDDDLVAFSARVPPALLTEGGKLRAFYKMALQGLLPREIINKEKMGFGMPYIQLMRAHRPLSELVCDSLEGLKKRGFFRRDFLDRLIDGVRHDRPMPAPGILWDLMALELWFAARPPAR